MENKLLQSFVAYCKAHPDERFWQALRNWSGFAFIYASPMSKILEDDSDDMHYFWEEAKDTFYWETRNGEKTEQ